MLSSIFKGLLSCCYCFINVTAITDTPTYQENEWSTCCRWWCFPLITLFVLGQWWLLFFSDFIIMCFFSNLVFLLLLFPGYRRYLLVLMKPWIQATWLSAQVTVSAFSHLFYHACAWEAASWVTMSGWFYCCQVVLNKKAALVERCLCMSKSTYACVGCVRLLLWALVRRANRINGLVCECTCVCAGFLTEPGLNATHCLGFFLFCRCENVLEASFPVVIEHITFYCSEKPTIEIRS